MSERGDDLAAVFRRESGRGDALMPDEPEAAGLLALMLLTDARRDARTDAGGRMIRSRRGN